MSAHVDMPTCADMCRHVLICADMCQHVASLSAPLMPTILTYLHAGMCQHIWTCRHVLICADMCWHVPTCSIILGTSDTNHLDLTSMLACVSTCGHADMCWYVPTCANMWHHSQHLWYQSFGHDLQSSMCQHMWTCRHVLICADMCRHVPTYDIILGPSDTNHLDLTSILVYVSAHVDMPTCADMCRHVLICANM